MLNMMLNKTVLRFRPRLLNYCHWSWLSGRDRQSSDTFCSCRGTDQIMLLSAPPTSPDHPFAVNRVD